MLALVANSKWYGGGIKAAPLAEAEDGLLDMVFVKTLSRLRIPMLINKYKTGNHLGLDVCQYIRGKYIQLRSPEPVNINMDGEIMPASNDITLEIVPDALNFIVPGK